MSQYNLKIDKIPKKYRYWVWVLSMGMRLKPIPKTHFFWVQSYEYQYNCILARN